MSSYAIVQRGNFALLPCVLNCQQVSIGVVVTLTCATSPAKPSVREVHERNAMMSWGVTSPLITRSLADFAKIVEALDARDVSFVSVTQQFNTTSSMGCGRIRLRTLVHRSQFRAELWIHTHPSRRMLRLGECPERARRRLLLWKLNSVGCPAWFEDYFEDRLPQFLTRERLLDESAVHEFASRACGSGQYRRRPAYA